MAYLGKGKKPDLLKLAEALEITLPDKATIMTIKEIIVKQPDYDEEFVSTLLNSIIEERINSAEQEFRLKQEQEKFNLEKEEKFKILELKEKEIQLNYDLEKLRLDKGITSVTEPKTQNVELTLNRLIPKFDPNETDISLYLIIFERQARKAKIEENSWVNHLIGLLPMEIVQLLAREPPALAEDYAYVKKILLQKFKLSAESFRQKFTQYQKKPEISWKDFAFELKNYLNEWLAGLEITTIEELKDLMVVDQLKKRAKHEIKEHFLDKWPNLKSSDELIELFDNYDDVRKGSHKNYAKESRSEKGQTAKTFVKEKNVSQDSKFTFSRSPNVSERNRIFEKRVKPRCFHCHSPEHLRPSCPKLMKDRKVESVNNIPINDQLNFLEGYVWDGKVNGREIKFWRDTGATIDVICQKFIEPKDFSGEHVWIKQPLSLELMCLPLAIVELSGDFGTVKTKAAVCRNRSDENTYLLGNRTAALIKEKNNFEFFPVECVNMVQTRSQKRKNERDRLEKNRTENENIGDRNLALNIQNTSDVEGQVNFPNVNTDLADNAEGIQAKPDTKGQLDIPTLNNGVSESEYSAQVAPDTEGPIQIPDIQGDAPELGLLQISREKLIEAQRNCDDLTELFRQAEDENSKNKTYSVFKGLLVKNREDRLGNMTKLIVIPKELRYQIKSLCHSSTASHLGCNKAKDKLARYFYWPNCFKEMDEFVRSCDPCQRAGKPNDRKKAPLKLVPVIREVFTRLNLDTCGPLPITDSGNRYIVTAMCMSSRYPEAIPVPEISSITIIDALLDIFSRTGFPREIQVDQGTSFTSALTTEFFDKFGIKVSHSSVHHPQSNPIERFHRTMKRLIRALCLESEKKWDKHLPMILLSLRTVIHESIGFSPSELVFGRNLRTPETLLAEKWLEIPEENNLVTDYVLKLINRLKRCQEVACSRAVETQVKRKTWYDVNTVKRDFKENDLVLVLATSKPNKLSVQWIGPGTIRSKISETNYLVEIPGKKERTQIYHVNMLKPYYKRPEHVNLAICEDNLEKGLQQDLEIPYLEYNSTVYDFQDIIRDSNLDKVLKSAQIDQLRELLNKYVRCFSNEPGLTDLVEHDIELTSDTPIRSRPYRTSLRQNEILKSEIQRMLKLGIIEVGESDYSSPIILVEVPGKDPRPCVDYRRLNKVIKTEYYPIPNIEERVEQVSAANYITIFDLARGYWQIPLSKRAQRYAAFCTTFGSYRPLRMNFGLKNAPYFFSKLMAELLRDFEAFAVPYLDDVAIFSKTWESHLQHIKQVLDRISKAKLTIKPSKCKFAQNQVKYLGHIVGKSVRSPAEAKIHCIQAFPTPRTKTHIREFLGLAGYYARYIDKFSVIAAPLTDALKGKAVKGEITWTAECEKAFQTLKKKLASTPVLHAPNFSKEFIVQTDASNVGMGVVLSQVNEQGEEHPVLYLSKKFSDVEKRYGTTEKECACIIFAIKKLHYYLDGQKFQIVTDHNPLIWLRSNASANPRLMRWALALQPYDFVIKHRAGKENKNADSLSRAAVEN